MKTTAFFMLFCMIIACIFVAYTFTKPKQVGFAKSSFANIEWHPGGSPMIVSFYVANNKEKPVGGIIVGIRTDSGTQFSTTDGDGKASITPGEAEIREVIISGHVLMLGHSSVPFGKPTQIADGLMFDIGIK